MSAKNDQQGNQHPEATFIVLCLVLAGVAFLMWHFFSGYVIRGLFPIQWLQIKLVQLTSGIGRTGTEVLQFVEATITGDQDAWTIGIADFWAIRTIVGERVQWVMLGLTSIFVAILVQRSFRTDTYKRELSLNGLMSYNAEHWRTSTFSVAFDPDKLWPSMAPQRAPGEWLRDNEITYQGGDLDKAKAESVMIEQLGVLWQGIDNVALHIQVMLMIVGAHAVSPMSGSKKKASEKLRGYITVAYTIHNDPAKRDAFVASLIAPFLASSDIANLITEVSKKHSWTATILIEFLEKARKAAGVLPSAEFLWLKSVDRPLFYVLNNVGRRKYHVEGAGAMSHYFFEKGANRGLSEPRVENAVAGVLHYLKAEKMVDDLSQMPSDT